jgi:N-acetylglucosaminyl-diphospho-decaprenol L-rhamnosyltransferase
MIDLSILIVHYNTPGLLRQTLKGIRRANPQLNYEVILVDNNPTCRVDAKVRQEFPEVKIIKTAKNLGFGQGMNYALEKASGTYVLIFNPDIVVLPGSLEALVNHLKVYPEVGAVGPQLLHPDKSIQNSCYQFMKPSIIFYRRIPFLKHFSFAKKAIQEYLMQAWDHKETRAVDYLLGAAICLPRTLLEEVGGFDANFFMYFEDQDLCRRIWQKGYRVHYLPSAQMIHYHRRETAEGGFLKQLLNPLTRIQFKSAVYYYKKHKNTSTLNKEGM